MTTPQNGQLTKRGYLELPLKRLARHAVLGDHEVAALRNLNGLRCHAGRNQVLSLEGSESLQFVLEGWAAREWALPGGRHQIFELALPGDLIGPLPGGNGYPAHGCRALTNVTLIDATSLIAVGADGAPLYPGIVTAMEASARQQNRRLLEHVMRLVALNASDGISDLVLELYRRHAEIGLAEGGRFPFIVGQSCLGQLLGLSSVHVNRSLKKLKDLGQVRFEAGWCRLQPPAQLADYLSHQAASGSGSSTP